VHVVPCVDAAVVVAEIQVGRAERDREHHKDETEEERT
jgi:hypothetical protein